MVKPVRNKDEIDKRMWVISTCGRGLHAVREGVRRTKNLFTTAGPHDIKRNHKLHQKPVCEVIYVD